MENEKKSCCNENKTCASDEKSCLSINKEEKCCKTSSCSSGKTECEPSKCKPRE